jgi:hypothetical protein
MKKRIVTAVLSIWMFFGAGGEIAGLRWTDVDLDGKILSDHKQSRGGRKPLGRERSEVSRIPPHAANTGAACDVPALSNEMGEPCARGVLSR